MCQLSKLADATRTAAVNTHMSVDRIYATGYVPIHQHSLLLGTMDRAHVSCYPRSTSNGCGQQGVASVRSEWGNEGCHGEDP
jgi:hypothetical protein